MTEHYARGLIRVRENWTRDGHCFVGWRDLTWRDDKNAPLVAVINQEFARRMFGSVTHAMGRYYKMPDGKRIQVVGIVEDGKYSLNLNDPLPPAMFLPILQSSSSETFAVVRSAGNPQQLATDIRTKLRDLDSGLPSFIQTWNHAMDAALFPSRMAALSLGVLGMMGGMLSVTGVFGTAAYSVSKRRRELGNSHGRGRAAERSVTVSVGTRLQIAGVWVGPQDCSSESWQVEC